MTPSKPRSAVFLPVVVLVFVFGIWLAWVSTSSSDGYSSLRNNFYSKDCKSTTGQSVSLSTNDAESTRNWIWDQLNATEQIVALQDARTYLVALVNILKTTEIDRWVSYNRCDVGLFGYRQGAHQLCNRPSNMTNEHDDCSFISFGISLDYSFDKDVATRWKCHGFAADPTIVHPSQLHDLVSFHNIAAKTLRDNQQKRDAEHPWWIASVPAVKKFLGLQHIDVLKMDCEGCEYSLARDILMEEPDFFHHVDQFTFEVHLNKNWVDDVETFYYLALLFKLLHEADLEVMGVAIKGCGKPAERAGSIQEFIDVGYPNAGAADVKDRRSCHEYLFARVQNETETKSSR